MVLIIIILILKEKDHFLFLVGKKSQNIFVEQFFFFLTVLVQHRKRFANILRECCIYKYYQSKSQENHCNGVRTDSILSIFCDAILLNTVIETASPTFSNLACLQLPLEIQFFEIFISAPFYLHTRFIKSCFKYIPEICSRCAFSTKKYTMLVNTCICIPTVQFFLNVLKTQQSYFLPFFLIVCVLPQTQSEFQN